MLHDARLEVAIAARRLDVAAASLRRDAAVVKAGSARLGPALVLGGGLALGVLAVLVPRPLRASALLGVLRFAWHRLVDTRPQDPV
ncbi:MAG: hypothetical protein U1F22_04040 [Lysobacterales bacterium]